MKTPAEWLQRGERLTSAIVAAIQADAQESFRERAARLVDVSGEKQGSSFARAIRAMPIGAEPAPAKPKTPHAWDRK